MMNMLSPTMGSTRTGGRQNKAKLTDSMAANRRFTSLAQLKVLEIKQMIK